MAANRYLENFFHTVTLSIPWDWAYIDISSSSREHSWALGVSHLHSQAAGAVTACAPWWPKPSLTNPRCGSRATTAEDRSQKMPCTQPPCFGGSESLIGQTGAAPCQLNAVPEKGSTNINIGLISPGALKSLQSILALAILQELVDLTSTLSLSAHHTLQPPPLLSSLQGNLSLQSGCFQLSQSFLNWPDKAVDKNQITNCCFFIYIYIFFKSTWKVSNVGQQLWLCSA